MGHYDFVFCLPFGSTFFFPSGGVNIVQLLSSHLRKSGYRVGILYLGKTGKTVEKIMGQILKSNALYRAFHFARGHEYDYGMLRGVDMLCSPDSMETDRIIATAWQTAKFASEYAKANPKAKAFYLIQNFESDRSFAGDSWKEAEESYGLKNLQKIVICEGLYDRFKEDRPLRFHVAVEDAAYFPDGTKKEDIILFPMRNNESKGLKYAMEAARVLHERLPGYRIEAFGEMPKGGIPGYIKHHGHPRKSELAKLYNRARIFIFPSTLEGFGSPGIEALACGCATVIADSIGVREYARDGYNCIMVPVRDPDAIAKAVERLAGDPALMEKLSKNGIETAKGMSYESMFESFDKLLDRM
jgi:glycosyltransferase involved in cell wall biosynthesis